MSIDRGCLTAPLLAPVEEVPQQLFFLAVHTDTGPARFSKGGPLAVQVLELAIALRVRFRVETLDIAFGSNLHVVE